MKNPTIFNWKKFGTSHAEYIRFDTYFFFIIRIHALVHVSTLK